MTHDVLARAFEQLTTWMRAHDAGVIADNLAAGASEAQLMHIEAQVGVPLPRELRALWSLHDGQREWGNGFYEWRDLLSIELALAEQETMEQHLELSREDRAEALAVGITAAELDSDAWIAVAGRDSDLVVVHALSGRVFECLHDDPPPKPLAGSVVEWMATYAARVLADDYAVEEGFGDRHLALRDRAAEASALDDERARAARAEALATAPLEALISDAIARSDPHACQDVLGAAERRQESSFTEAIALLFAGGAKPALVAEALRPRLRELSLSKAQWNVVLEGGTTLGNAAIVQLARERAKAAASAPSSKPWWKPWS